MLSIQKSSYVKTGLWYVTSFSSCVNSNSACHIIIIFVLPCDDIKIEKNASKMELESEVKNDKKKSILGAPLKLLKKKESRILNLLTPPTRRINQRRFTFVITMELLDTLTLIVTNGLLANRTTYGKQNQLQNSLAPLGELLEVVLLLSNFQGSTPFSPSSKCLPRRRNSSSFQTPCVEGKRSLPVILH